MNILDELQWRGLLHQTTGGDALTEHLKTPGRVAYCGFDPTAESLTIGNLIPIMLLKHWQRAGHRPIVLMGGGTGLIGDPSGKDAERQLRTPEETQRNVDAQKAIMERLIDFDESADNPTGALIVDNAQWLTKLGFIEVLRDIGKYFSVNNMIQKDSIRDRLHNREQGISYTEFSYSLLQAYDFLHLRRAKDCTVQIAGSDQYGNMVAGIDLVRRELGSEVFAITAPLVTKADGKKIGKTESGAIWLSAERTSPYAFYQFWINCSDDDVTNFLKWYTFLEREEIEALLAAHTEAPHKRGAQRRLAQEVTRMLHGEEQLKKVEAATQALFGGDITALDADMLQQVFADVASSDHPAESLRDGVALVELLPETTLATSKREARQFLSSGAVSVNGQKVGADAKITDADLLHGRTILLRRGKKQWHATRWA